MKKNLCYAAFLTLSIFLTSCYGVKSEKVVEDKNYITVSGTGAVSVRPDMVSLKFYVKTSDWNVNKAAEQNAENSTNVINALADLGITGDDVKTYDYRISQDNSKDYPGQYTVQNTICVNIHNIDSVGAVIDAAVKNGTGANGISQFKYVVTDKSAGLQQARSLAVQDALNAASLLAGASGCAVGDVVDIRENYTSSDSYSNDRMAFMDESSAGPTTPITDGSVTITSNITVKYQITKSKQK